MLKNTGKVKLNVLDMLFFNMFNINSLICVLFFLSLESSMYYIFISVWTSHDSSASYYLWPVVTG